MKNIFRFVICLLSFLVVAKSDAQTTKYVKHKKVLLIPFNRFEFHTELKLSMINDINQMEKDQYYPALVQAFSDAFVLGDFNKVKYFVMSDVDYASIMPYIRFKSVGKEGHYNSDLELLHQNIYQKLLEDYDCDFVLIINWYRILERKESVKLKGGRRFGIYTEHLIDYDFYDDQKHRLSYGANKKFKVKPTVDNLEYGGVRISELRTVFKELADNISEEIIPPNN